MGSSTVKAPRALLNRDRNLRRRFLQQPPVLVLVRDDIVAEPGDRQRPTQFTPGVKQWHAQSGDSDGDVLVGDTEASFAGKHGICFDLVCRYEGMRG